MSILHGERTVIREAYNDERRVRCLTCNYFWYPEITVPRAMVDGDRHFHWSNAVAEMTPEDQADWIASVAGDDDEAVIARMKAPTPRALVAISEDRQWLVVHSTERAVGFDIYKLVKDRWRFSYEPLNWPQIEDTGQSADEVLATFLAGRKT